MRIHELTLSAVKVNPMNGRFSNLLVSFRLDVSIFNSSCSFKFVLYDKNMSCNISFHENLNLKRNNFSPLCTDIQTPQKG